MIRRAAVTGGTGFIGAALVDRLLASGVEVVALARSPQKLGDVSRRITVVHGDLGDGDALARLCDGADAVFHCAGLTFARRDEDYARINVAGAAAVARAAAPAARLVCLSSLSAREAGLSPYAASKFAGEGAVSEARAGARGGERGEAPTVSLRLPAVYGPRDLATLPYFRLIARGLALEPATRPDARASLLYVEDAAAAIIAAASSPFGNGGLNGVYEVGDDRPDGRAWREIGQTLAGVLGVTVRRLRLPKPLVATFHRAAIAGARLFNAPPPARTGQANEFFHPDWVARNRLLSDTADWRAATNLEAGFEKTVHWLKENGYV